MNDIDNKPTLEITETAIQEIAKAMAEAGAERGSGLRVSIVGGGCSGYQYQMDIETDARPDDEIMMLGSVNIFIDPISAGYLKGTTIDYKKTLQGAGFTFHNPNAKRTCGCGSSFS